MAKTAATHSSLRIKPVTVLAGTEMFLRHEILDQIRNTFRSENDSDFGYVRLDETATALTILDECRTVGMFAPKKLVVVDPADPLFRPRGGAAAATTEADDAEADMEDESDSRADVGVTSPRDLILRYAEAPSENCTLVLVCSKWLTTTRLHKFLYTQGAIHSCEPLSEHAVPPWITQRAKNTYSKIIQPDAAMRLAELIGPDLARLDSELQKLDLYTGSEPQISVAAVDALVGFQHEHKVWNLINALAEGDTATALVRHDELWQIMDKKIGYSLVGAVFFWLNQVLKVREMLDRRLPENQIVRELKLYPPPRAAATIRLARRWELAGAYNASAALLAADMASKTSVGEPRRNMECFIVRLGGK